MRGIRHWIGLRVKEQEWCGYKGSDRGKGRIGRGMREGLGEGKEEYGGRNNAREEGEGQQDWLELEF